MRRITIFAAALMIGTSVTAHEGGHGPKSSDTGKFGGIVASVILKSEVELGDKATLVYKAELVRAADNTVRLYLYDRKMQPKSVKTFAAKAPGDVESKIKGKWVEHTFELELKDGVFIGKLPKAEKKPFNVDIFLKEGDKEYLAAFENLD